MLGYWGEIHKVLVAKSSFLKQRNIRINQQAIQDGERKKMQIKVHYISLVKSYTNKSQEELSLSENATIADLLDQIAKRYGNQFIQEVYDPVAKEMKSTFVTMINGVLMDQLKGVSTPLKNGDNIILMSLMTGG